MKKIEKYLNKLKIDKKYYQADGLKEALIDDKVYLHVNFSNRRDGKSFTTTDILIDLMLKFNIKVLFLARDERSRVSYFNQMEKVIRETGKYKEEYLEYRNIQRWYINVYYNSEHIASIIDYSEIDSLKNESAFLSQFSVIFIDEFIVQSYRYLRNEYTLLKVLYKSVNRENKTRLFKLPKILLAGNATNFDSPLLSGFDLLNIVETQELNTSKKYERNSVSIIVEKHKNESANVKQEDDMFPDENEDANSLGDFVFNSYNIEKPKKNMKNLVIDFSEFYLYLYFDTKMKNIIFEVKGTASYSDYCINKADETDEVIYLSDKYFQNFNKFDRQEYKYANSYSKSLITRDNFIKSLKFGKMMSYKLRQLRDRTDIIYQEDFNNVIVEERAKAYLSSQYNLEI